MASPRYDSGRSSPGAYSAATYDHRTSRRKSGRKRPDGERIVYGDPAVRYGMLGIVGEEPRCDRMAYVREDCPPTQAAYYYIEEDAAPLSPRSAETYDHQAPTVVITEATTDQSSASPTDEAPVSKSSSSEGGEERRKRTERDIRELEDMYRKCSLSGSDWNDLLERADRREAVHQTRTDQTARTRPLSRSKSDTLYESGRNLYERPHQRAPPLRRSGVPDIVADDMALRKHNRPATVRPFDPTDRTVTYMLCSSHFTPAVQSGPTNMLLLDGDRPDVEHDDWSYRKHYVGKGGPDPPQPPFGIPIRPPPPRHSDYLRHAVPSSARHTRALCHPRGNPDVVRDDLAYRTLRKDEPDRLYYEATDVYRKKRA